MHWEVVDVSEGATYCEREEGCVVKRKSLKLFNFYLVGQAFNSVKFVIILQFGSKPFLKIVKQCRGFCNLLKYK